MSSYYFTRIIEAINLLVDIKNIFRQNRPTFTMDKSQLKEIKNQLIKLNGILEKLNMSFGIKPSSKQDNTLNFKGIIKNKFFIISSPKNRKKLIDLGVDSAQILATGGPITISDIRTLNPHITESGLKNFQNKIQKFWKILKSKLQAGNFIKLILLLEKNNTADKILLYRKNEFEKNLSIAIQTVTISSINQLDNQSMSILVS